MDELTAWLILLRAPGLSVRTLAPLLQTFASVNALATASQPELQAAGASPKLRAWLQSPPRLETLECERRWLGRDTHHLVTWGSEHYPERLADLSDAPVALFVRGNPALLRRPQLAMVGSRNPSPAGVEIARGFAAELAGHGFSITSGLAEGIDAASHQGALDAGGTTVAICGTGLARCYPAAHRPLADQISSNGALISEFPLDSRPIRANFVRRNRLIATLSSGTLVVEAALHSGSLITARLAARHGRRLFAIPGSLYNPLARGCHELIREGALLTQTAEDVLEGLSSAAQISTAPHVAPRRGVRRRPPGHASLSLPLEARMEAPPKRSLDTPLNPPGTAPTQAPTAAPTPAAAATPKPPASTRTPEISGTSRNPLDKGYEILLDALGFEPAGVDLLVVRTGLRADEVASMLLMLELAGRVASHPGGLYVRARPKAVK